MIFFNLVCFLVLNIIFNKVEVVKKIYFRNFMYFSIYFCFVDFNNSKVVVLDFIVGF